MGTHCWNFSGVSCSKILKMRASVLLAACFTTIIVLVDFSNSTFTNTGALTLSIPALTTGTLTGTQVAALGLGAAGLLGAAGIGLALGAAARGAAGGGGGRSSGRSQRQRGGGNKRYGRAVVEEEVDETEFVFKAIAEMDVADCAKRYLCEISGTPVDQLSSQDINTLTLFEAPTSRTGSFKRSFEEAAFLGTSSGDIGVCQQRYPKCDIQGSALANILNNSL